MTIGQPASVFICTLLIGCKETALAALGVYAEQFSESLPALSQEKPDAYVDRTPNHTHLSPFHVCRECKQDRDSTVTYAVTWEVQ